MAGNYAEWDKDGRPWRIVKNPAGWVAYLYADQSVVLDPYRTLRETREAIKGISVAWLDGQTPRRESEQGDETGRCDVEEPLHPGS